jgi:hypothetical protein
MEEREKKPPALVWLAAGPPTNHRDEDAPTFPLASRCRRRGRKSEPESSIGLRTHPPASELNPRTT